MCSLYPNSCLFLLFSFFIFFISFYIEIPVLLLFYFLYFLFSSFYLSLIIQIPVLFFSIFFIFFMFLYLTLYPNPCPSVFLFSFISFFLLSISHPLSKFQSSWFSFFFIFLFLFWSKFLFCFLFSLFILLFLTPYQLLFISSFYISSDFFFLSVTPSSLLLMPLSCFALFLPFFIYCVWNAGQIMHKKHGRADERPDSKFYSFYGKKMICF